MATKKSKTVRKKVSEPVAAAPDLEEKRKKFQEAVKHQKTAAKKSAPKHHSNRKRTLIIAVGALLVTLGSALVAYSYFFWYQTPDKMVHDALSNAVATSNVRYSAEVNSPTASIATVEGGYAAGRAEASATIRTMYPGELQTLNGAFMSTDRDLYVKLSHAGQVAREVVPKEQKPIVDTLLPSIQGKVDDKWLYLQSKDVGLFEGVTSLSSCSVNAYRALMINQQARTALQKVYLQHSFFIVKETGAERNYGTYQLTIDKEKFHAFLDEITKSEPTVPFSACVKEVAAVKKSAIDTSVIELIIDKTQRSIKQVLFSTSGKDAVTVMISPTFGHESAIEVPKDAQRFDEIKTLFLSALLRQ